MKTLSLGRLKILLVNCNGRFYALEALCPHMSYPLDLGSLSDHTLRCGFHYAEFDVVDGEVLKQPVDSRPIRGLKSYPVRVDEDSIMVLVEDDLEVEEQSGQA